MLKDITDCNVFWHLEIAIINIMSKEIFNACTENVKGLKKEKDRIKKMANRAIRENKDDDLNLITKLYALLYSAYAEESFLKLLHTPNAFTDSEINEIENNSRNLDEKWKKCINIAFRNLNENANLREILNKKQTLTRIQDKYIIEPSKIRNKVAHGQWIVCLNNDCTRINDETTDTMQTLDFVEIDRLFGIYDIFHQCILDLSVSPKTHYRDYYGYITKLEKYIYLTSNWSMESKKKKILLSKKMETYKKMYNQTTH